MFFLRFRDFGAGGKSLTSYALKTARRGVAALGVVLFDGHTLGLAQQVDAIVADGRVYVCDGAHRAFVMKNLKQ